MARIHIQIQETCILYINADQQSSTCSWISQDLYGFCLIKSTFMVVHVLGVSQFIKGHVFIIAYQFKQVKATYISKSIIAIFH